ncbi:hypothetical protein IQ266_11460 [filamentous cyanobacterium LEGE 11480]|uniref:Uncharacterized protein n=1 Tax=Romeriopsis navalis LEGE 11480 TaxID=2777977 RepID=A0A928Z4I1_9CYAN|nr:hypothetical protein [Romeriopsis navalis]MBE9030348.1 hypothetical protein [Romeriopsis navalis LEGE 11480]
MNCNQGETQSGSSWQIVGMDETDVLCMFLGKRWKMRSASRPFDASSSLPVETPAVSMGQTDPEQAS